MHNKITIPMIQNLETACCVGGDCCTTQGGWLWVEIQPTSGDVCLLVPVPAPVALQDMSGLDAWVMVACVVLVFCIDFVALAMPRHGMLRMGRRGTRHERERERHHAQRTCVLDATGM